MFTTCFETTTPLDRGYEHDSAQTDVSINQRRQNISRSLKNLQTAENN